MSKKKIGLLSAAVVVFVVVFVAFAGTALAAYDFTNHIPDKAMVLGSDHDTSVAGGNPCDGCHIPHGAKGAFLFANAPLKSGGGLVSPYDDAGITSDIKPLCYSCHDGLGPEPGAATVFNTTHSNHRTRAASDVTATDPVTGAQTLRGPSRDCDLCHDPHDNGNVDADGNGYFLKYERYSSRNGGHWYTLTAGGNFCASCHTGNVDATGMTSHRTNVHPSAASMPVDALWVPGGGDYSGTRLYDPAANGTAVNPAAAGFATAQAKCGSCHTPHGATPNVLGSAEDFQHLNTMTAEGTTAVYDPNTKTLVPGPADGTTGLCLNCHGAKKPAA